MTKILSSIWGLFLNIIGINIFHMCFANSMVDEEGDPLVSGPPITSQLFACGVYVIIVNIAVFPTNFRKPPPPVLCLYEFLATAFLLEFSVACIWSPIDVLVMTTLPDLICHVMNAMKYEDAGEWINKNDWLKIASTIALSICIFLSSLHVTRAVELSVISSCGLMEFANQAKSRLWSRILNELPEADIDNQDCRCPHKSTKSRRGRKSKTRRRRSSS